MATLNQIQLWLKVFALALGATLGVPALAGIGDIDPAFGDGGLLQFPSGFGNLTALPHGNLQLLSMEPGRIRVLRLHQDGLPDLGFGSAGILESATSSDYSAYNALQIRSAQTIDEGSTYLNVDAQYTVNNFSGTGVYKSEARLARISGAGLPDPQFGQDGTRAFPFDKVPGAWFSFIWDYVVASSGALYVLVGYYAEEYDCATGMFLYRLDLTGELDTGFGAGGEYRVDTDNNCYWGSPFQLVALTGDKLLLNSASPVLLDAQGHVDTVPAAWQQWLQSRGETRIYDGGDFLYTVNTSIGAGVHAVIGRWQKNLGLDTTFGAAGTGISEFDVTDLPFAPARIDLVQLLAPKSSNEFLYVDVTVDSGPPSSGNAGADSVQAIVRLQSGGALDKTFGVAGVVLTNAPLNPVQQQPDGSLVAGMYARAIRLAGASIDSPGLLMSDAACDYGNSVEEAAGPRLIRVWRTLGSRGPVSMDFHTQGLSATPGADYTDVSGTLSWANAEVGEKTIAIPILDDALVEPDEDFNVFFERLTGDAVSNCEKARMVIYSNDPGSLVIGLPPPPTAPVPPVTPAVKTASGGGGSFDFTLAGLLASLLLVRAVRRSDRQSAPRFRLTVRPTRLPSP